MAVRARKSPAGGVTPNSGAGSASQGSTVSDTPAQGAAQGTGPTGTSPGAGKIAMAIATYRVAEAQLYTVLAQWLETLAPGEIAHHYKAHSAQEEAIPMITALMRKYPEIVLDTSPDVIDGNYADAQGCTLLVQDYLLASTRVKDTRILRVETAWTDCSAVLAFTRKKAKTNKPMAQDLSLIEAKLKLGSRDDTAPMIAVKKQAAADHISALAQSSEANATAATSRANAAVAKRRAKVTPPADPATGATTPSGTTPPTGSGTSGTSGGH